MRTTRRLAYSVGIIVSLIAAVVLPATAAAAGPQHSNFSGTKTNFHLCGFNTTLTFSVVDNLWPVFDSLGNLVAEKDIHQEKDIVTAANGRSIEIQAANMITTTFTTNPDGSFQIVTTYRGLSEQIKTPNG